MQVLLWSKMKYGKTLFTSQEAWLHTHLLSGLYHSMAKYVEALTLEKGLKRGLDLLPEEGLPAAKG